MAKQKVSFVFRWTKGLQRKAEFFRRTKRKSTETIMERCFPCQNKSVCQKLARSCKKWNSAKIQYTPFLHEALQLFRSTCVSFSRNNVCRKTQLSPGDLLFKEKQKKPSVSLSFISLIITEICYCCFVSASDWGAEWGLCEFVLSWHGFETRSADFFSFFICFFTYFKNQKNLFKENVQ